MYLQYYGLNEPPFSITPNPRFLFFSPRHREAFNHLLYGIRERKGFVQLTGEVGAGKTTLCRALLDQLGPNYSTALILNPVLDADQLIKAIAMEFNLVPKRMDRLEILAMLNKFLLQQVEQGRESVLIIDEAQNLTLELLEQVRLLSNLETDERKLFQIVLMGQTELRDRLQPLRRSEVGHYIQHRIQVSGGNGAPYFTMPALWRIYRYSRGIPRLINALCDKCLLAGYVKQSQTINYRMVGMALRELEGDLGA
jgi:general secretion pathway protein A